MRLLHISLYGMLFAVSSASILKRAEPVCTDLRAKANNGDRKIAIVVDSSGSMSLTDPYDNRLTAAKQTLDWLVSKSEATSSKKEDQVTIIDFADDANLDYALSEVNLAAESAINKITSSGGTSIYSGVEMAIAELTKDGSGDTAGRTGILVFTDGEVSLRLLALVLG